MKGRKKLRISTPEHTVTEFLYLGPKRTVLEIAKPKGKFVLFIDQKRFPIKIFFNYPQYLTIRKTDNINSCPIHKGRSIKKLLDYQHYSKYKE